MIDTVQDHYDEDDFESLLDDAESNAANDWEEQFVADIRAAIGDPHGKILLDGLVDAVRERIEAGDKARSRLDAYEHAIAEIHRHCSDAGIKPGVVHERVEHLAMENAVLHREVEQLRDEYDELSQMGFEDGRNRLQAECDRLQADLDARTDSLHNACAALGKIGERLGTDPDEGGAGPILEAIDVLVAELATERQAREALQEQLNATADEHDEIAGRTVGYLLPVSKKRGLYRRVKSFDDAQRIALSHARRGGRVEVGAFVPIGEAVPGAEWRGVK